MNTFPFLAYIADAVGVPATNWEAPGIIFLKFLAIVFLVLLNGFFVASELAIVKVCASQPDTLTASSNRCARLAARHQPLRGLFIETISSSTFCSGACHILSGLAEAFAHLALVFPAKRDPVDRLAARLTKVRPGTGAMMMRNDNLPANLRLRPL
jgi:hypothetical protein